MELRINLTTKIIKFMFLVNNSFFGINLVRISDTLGTLNNTTTAPAKSGSLILESNSS